MEMEVSRKFNTIEIEHEIMIGLLGLLADKSIMVVPEKSDMEAIYIFFLPFFFLLLLISLSNVNKLGESLISDKQLILETNNTLNVYELIEMFDHNTSLNAGMYNF